MEAVVLCGIQGSGKTTLYRDRFLATHVRVALDLLRTRAREEAFVRLCLETQQPFVVDNTNPTAADRRRYVEPARAAGFRTIAYLVEVDAA
jgi:predicted kinase